MRIFSTKKGTKSHLGNYINEYQMNEFSRSVIIALCAVENPVESTEIPRQSLNPSLLRADQFIGYAAPTDFVCDQRVHKVRQVQEWHERS